MMLIWIDGQDFFNGLLVNFNDFFAICFYRYYFLRPMVFVARSSVTTTYVTYINPTPSISLLQ